jgi:hypothetical protein
MDQIGIGRQWQHAVIVREQSFLREPNFALEQIDRLVLRCMEDPSEVHP